MNSFLRPSFLPVGPLPVDNACLWCTYYQTASVSHSLVFFKYVATKRGSSGHELGGAALENPTTRRVSLIEKSEIWKVWGLESYHIYYSMY